MFAKMKDGTIKPVQYHYVGALIQGGARALPYLSKYGIKPLGSAIKKGLGYFKPFNYKGLNQNINAGVQGSGKIKDVFPGLTSKVAPKFNIMSTNPANIALQAGVTAAPFVPGLYETMTETETEKETVLPKISDEQRKRDQEDEQRGMPKDDKKDVKNFDDMLKKGDLDSMIKDKIEIFEKYLGKDVDKRKKSAGYNAMIEFGLNLASARGGNLVDKISRSAKDPMAKFADVGRKILDRAEQIKMAGVEAGITASEKAADRDVELQSIAADKEIQQMKNDATKMDKQQFMLEYSGKLLTDSDALKQVMRPYLDDNGKLPEGTTPQMIVQGTLENVWQSSQPKIITEELITLAQNTPGNEELSREEIIQGYIANGYSLK
jgi:hypothetical protein